MLAKGRKELDEACCGPKSRGRFSLDDRRGFQLKGRLGVMAKKGDDDEIF